MQEMYKYLQKTHVSSYSTKPPCLKNHVVETFCSQYTAYQKHPKIQRHSIWTVYQGAII